MDSETKRKCFRNEGKTLDSVDNTGEDLISDLPDCVLAHILSKLPTKFAVGTAILSTKWKHLFALIPQPRLVFDDSLLLHPQNLESSYSSDGSATFANFTSRVLDVVLKEVPCISTFKLKCTAYYEDDQILDWLASALERGPYILDIDLQEGLESPWLLFEFISEWESILGLALRNGMSVYVPESFLLPNLVNLVLDRIHFPDDENVSRALSGCPLLQGLTMRYLEFEYVENFTISNPLLEYLSIEDCWSGMDTDNSYNKVVIDTPALEELYYEDIVPDKLILKNINSLRIANIHALALENLDEASSLQDYQDIAALVRACSNVTELFLSKDAITALTKSGEELPTFCKLTKLGLGGFDINGWELLPRLLQETPKLEYLYITKEFHAEEGCFDLFMSNLSGKGIAPCLVSSLVKLRIFHLKEDFCEQLLIFFFLLAGKVLNTVNITSFMSLETFDRFFEMLEHTAEKAGILDRCRITTRNITL